MEISVGIDILFRTKAKAEAVYQSVSPDNVGIPEGLALTMKIKGKVISVEMSSASQLDTLISTLDDLLKSCQLSLDSLTSLVTCERERSC